MPQHLRHHFGHVDLGLSFGPTIHKSPLTPEQVSVLNTRNKPAVSVLLSHNQQYVDFDMHPGQRSTCLPCLHAAVPVSDHPGPMVRSLPLAQARSKTSVDYTSRRFDNPTPSPPSNVPSSSIPVRKLLCHFHLSAISLVVHSLSLSIAPASPLA
jgi:hypothetical protein